MQGNDALTAHDDTAHLVVRGLRAGFPTAGDGFAEILHGVDLDVPRGKTLAIVGESGSGKSVTALALLGLLQDAGGRVSAGTAVLDGTDLFGLSEKQWCARRGALIGAVFQDPFTSLNPVQTIGRQLAESISLHGDATARRSVRELSGEALRRVGLPQPDRLLRRYPHELSGGMRQRVMIALATINRPPLLILDEPTTALDATVQAQILDLMRDLQQDHAITTILITHDFGVVAEIADNVAVMYQGSVVEQGSVRSILDAPAHEYTRTLIAGRSVESGPVPPPAEPSATSLEVTDLRAQYRVPKSRTVFTAVDGVSLSVARGSTHAVVGESGCGKSTLLRSIARLIEPSGGSVRLGDVDLLAQRGRELRTARSRIQMVFQDPSSSLDARMTVGALLTEPLVIHRVGSKQSRNDRTKELLDLVKLPPEAANRSPHEFSGGQRQRIGIARALALDPDVVLLDEPVSALDLTVQRQILDLLRDIQARLGVAYVFITHDLAVVREVAHWVSVMYLGRIVESGPADQIFAAPAHPYTAALLSAEPIADGDPRPGRQRIRLAGDPPDPADPPSGCRFRTRCWKAQDLCARVSPDLGHVGDADEPPDRAGRVAACHFPLSAGDPAGHQPHEQETARQR